MVQVTDWVYANDPTYNNAWNFIDGSDVQTEYEYDENGNVTKDLNRNTLSIEYNSLNLQKNTCVTRMNRSMNGYRKSIHSYSSQE